MPQSRISRRSKQHNIKKVRKQGQIEQYVKCKETIQHTLKGTLPSVTKCSASDNIDIQVISTIF